MGSPRSVLHPPAVPGKAKTAAALPSHHPSLCLLIKDKRQKGESTQTAVNLYIKQVRAAPILYAVALYVF